MFLPMTAFCVHATCCSNPQYEPARQITFATIDSLFTPLQVLKPPHLRQYQQRCLSVSQLLVELQSMTT
jgi:hypothetical protein